MKPLSERPWERFYSKLVRLKGSIDAAFRYFDDRFYSKLVRLKVCLGINNCLFIQCFYSKLVRLKEIEFLSQNPEASRVSIPNWFD